MARAPLAQTKLTPMLVNFPSQFYPFLSCKNRRLNPSCPRNSPSKKEHLQIGSSCNDAEHLAAPMDSENVFCDEFSRRCVEDPESHLVIPVDLGWCDGSKENWYLFGMAFVVFERYIFVTKITGVLTHTNLWKWFFTESRLPTSRPDFWSSDGIVGCSLHGL